MDMCVFLVLLHKISCDVSSLHVGPWSHSSQLLQPYFSLLLLTKNTEANTMETVIIICPTVLL